MREIVGSGHYSNSFPTSPNTALVFPKEVDPVGYDSRNYLRSILTKTPDLVSWSVAEDIVLALANKLNARKPMIYFESKHRKSLCFGSEIIMA